MPKLLNAVLLSLLLSVGSALAQDVNPSQSPVERADAQSGTDACAKIANAIAALKAANPRGGVVDARAITGTQMCINPAAWFPSSVAGIVVELGAVNLQVTNTLVVGNNVRVVGTGWSSGVRGSVISAANSFSSTFTNSDHRPRPAVVVLGSHEASNQGYTFGDTLENVAIDCTNHDPCIGVYSESINELGGLDRVRITQYSTRALWIEATGKGSPQNFMLKDLYVVTQNPASAAIDGVVRLDASGNSWHGLFGITIDNGGKIKPGSVGIKIASGFLGGTVTGVHCEEIETCIEANTGANVIGANGGGDGVTQVVHIPMGAQGVFLSDIQQGQNTSHTIVSDDCGTFNSYRFSLFSTSIGQAPLACSYAGADGLNVVVGLQNVVNGTSYTDKAVYGASFSSLRARGTPVNPAAVQGDDVIGGWFGKGHNGEGFDANWTVSIRELASEPHTPSAAGTKIDFATTPNGATSRIVRLTIDESGKALFTAYSGHGNGFACFDSAGRLYRSETACK